MPLQQLEAVVTAETVGRINLVVRTLTGRARADVRGLFAHECVTLNGSACAEPGTVAAVGDVVGVRHDPHRRYHAPPPERTSAAFQVIYEDEHLIVVNKAANVLTVPTDRGDKHTLVEVVTQHVRRKNARAIAGVVQRLDRGTSGLLVFGKTEAMTAALRDQFRVRKAERQYVAIVAGRLADDTGTLASRLGTSKSLQQRSVGDDEEGEAAVTHFRVINRLRGVTVVIATLETGRRNQIRVQFAEAGHPVLGDERYMPKLAKHPAWKVRRLALHACVLGFDHPLTGQSLRFESPWPEEMQRFCERPRPRRS